MNAVEVFWQRYVATLPTGAAPAYTAWAFGDNAELADELGQLVQAGVKTGTASLLWEHEHDAEPLPAVGDLSIILDSAGNPLCIIETTQIDIMPFNEVSAEHAYSEGEGDRSLADWREGHWRFFSRSCARIGREPDEAMPIVCERFRVVFQPGAD